MEYDILIQGGTIVDGTGQAGFTGDVGILGEKIVRIGRLEPGEGTNVIQAQGMVVCPGFIDAHCHTDVYAADCPDAAGKIMQGVTTDVCGLCGDSPVPVGEGNLREYIRRREYKLPGSEPAEACTFGEYRDRMNRLGNTTNMALFTGNANLRVHGVGYENRAASDGEMEQMKGLLKESMEEGAWGLSTGLTYVPSMFASTEELTELCRTMAAYGGIYNSHMRNEGDRVEDSIKEVIAIARDSGCRGHISHLKVSGKANHGKSERCLELIHRADDEGIPVTFDVYPYTAGSCGLRTLLPPGILELGIEDDFHAMKARDVYRETVRLLEEDSWDNLLKSCGSENIMVSSAGGIQAYEGKSIRQIAEELSAEDAEAVMKVLGDTGAQAGIIYYALCEEDLRRFLTDPLCTVGTDAFARNYTGPTAAGKPHPRNYGAFPRFIRKYLLEEKLMPLEKGIEKITSLTAAHFGLRERGALREGYQADVTIFDPSAIGEKGSFLNPAVKPEGIRWVLVSGRPAVADGEFAPVRRGRVLKRV
ncbi:MAG: D-aminoacylase [Clostridium sp.]|nr:D-aminoacylase [Clostridium sp.]